jgi:hypothetical protein
MYVHNNGLVAIITGQFPEINEVMRDFLINYI